MTGLRKDGRAKGFMRWPAVALLLLAYGLWLFFIGLSGPPSAAEEKTPEALLFAEEDFQEPNVSETEVTPEPVDLSARANEQVEEASPSNESEAAEAFPISEQTVRESETPVAPGDQQAPFDFWLLALFMAALALVGGAAYWILVLRKPKTPVEPLEPSSGVVSAEKEPATKPATEE